MPYMFEENQGNTQPTSSFESDSHFLRSTLFNGQDIREFGMCICICKEIPNTAIVRDFLNILGKLPVSVLHAAYPDPTALSTPSEAGFCGLFYNPEARSIVPAAGVWAFVMSGNYDNPHFWVTSGVKTVIYIYIMDYAENMYVIGAREDGTIDRAKTVETLRTIFWGFLDIKGIH